MPEQAEEEDEENYNDVVHAKIGGVGSDSLKCFGKAGRNGERPELDHFLPWPERA